MLTLMKALWVIHVMYLSVLQIIHSQITYLDNMQGTCGVTEVTDGKHMGFRVFCLWGRCKVLDICVWLRTGLWSFMSLFCAAAIKQSSSTFPYSHGGNWYPFLVFWHLSINHSEINTYRHMNMNTHVHTTSNLLGYKRNSQ